MKLGWFVMLHHWSPEKKLIPVQAPWPQIHVIFFFLVCSTHDPHCLSHLKVSLYIFLLYWGYEGSHVRSLSFSCWLIDMNNNSFCFQATANLHSSYCWNGFRTVFFKCLKVDCLSVSLDSFTPCLRNTSSLICAWFYGI